MSAAAAPAVQLSFEVEGLDPHELARLETPDRGQLFAALELNPLQIACAEEAVRRVRSGEYGSAG